MFSLLSLFRKTADEALVENDYDFNETPVSVIDTQGEVGAQKPVLIDNAFGGQQERPIRPSPPKEDFLEIAKKVKIDTVRDELNDMLDPLDVSDIDHRRVRKYKPKYVGRGGENIVYALPDHPEIVVKAEVEPLMRQVEAAKAEELPVTNKITAQQRADFRERLADENTSYDELLRFFGEDHVPHTNKSILKVPLSKDILETIYRERRAPVPDFTLEAEEMWTLVAIQEKVPQIADDKSLDVRGGFAERRKPENMGDIEKYKQAYYDATQSLVCDPENASFDLDQFLVIHPDLRAIITQTETNPQLKDALKDFVEKAMNYTKQTGKSLDLAGAKNILFFKNPDNTWSYKLVDALSHYSEVALERAKELVAKIIAREPFVDGEQFAVTSAVNYIRSMNGLAKYLGIEEHIDMPQVGKVTPSEFWDVLYEGKPQPSSNQKQEAISA